MGNKDVKQQQWAKKWTWNALKTFLKSDVM